MNNSLDDHLAALQNTINEQTLENYGEEVFKRWKKPEHMGRMEDADAFFSLTGGCGDTMEVYLKFDRERITQASFFSSGCGASVVCGSVACELALGKNIEEAASISGEDILSVLNHGLPEDKEHCAYLAAQGLQEAVHVYARSRQQGA